MQRTLSIRPCAEHELTSLVAQASRIFKPDDPSPSAMATAYPILFAETNRANLWVGCDGATLVGHVGYVPRTIIGHAGRRAVATFGAVFVDERYRGNQIATQLLSAAVNSARAQGATMGWVSGRRDLYRRQGFTPLPGAPVLRIANAPTANAGALAMAAITPSQWTQVAALHANTIPRFDRNPQQWQAILRSRTVFFSAGQVYGAYQRNGVLSAYVAVEDVARLRAGKLWRRAWEWGGAPQDAHQMLQAMATPDVGIEWVWAPNLSLLPSADGEQGLVDLQVSVAHWSQEVGAKDLPLYGLDYV